MIYSSDKATSFILELAASTLIPADSRDEAFYQLINAVEQIFIPGTVKLCESPSRAGGVP
jgi:hypothetical protein